MAGQAARRRPRADKRIQWPRFGALESAPYGSLKLADGESYRIWLTRHEEPEPSPEFDMRTLLALDDDEDKRRLLARQIMEFAQRRLDRKWFIVLHCRYVLGMTLQEVADVLQVTQERVRQIESLSIGWLRRLLGGEKQTAAGQPSLALVTANEQPRRQSTPARAIDQDEARSRRRLERDKEAAERAAILAQREAEARAAREAQAAQIAREIASSVQEQLIRAAELQKEAQRRIAALVDRVVVELELQDSLRDRSTEFKLGFMIRALNGSSSCSRPGFIRANCMAMLRALLEGRNVRSSELTFVPVGHQRADQFWSS